MTSTARVLTFGGGVGGATTPSRRHSSHPTTTPANLRLAIRVVRKVWHFARTNRRTALLALDLLTDRLARGGPAA